jgi:hypothetical protein
MRDRLSKMSNSQVILTLVLITIATMFISTSLTQGGVNAFWWANWFQNISADMISAIITFLLLVLVVDRRDKHLASETIWREEQKIHKIMLKQQEDLAGKQEVLNKMMARDLLRDINLEGYDLGGLTLSYADFSGARLVGTKFVGTTLIAANFKGAFAPNADFRNANLIGANLEDARFRSAKFDKAFLQSANLKNSFLAGGNFSASDLTNADMCLAELDDPEIHPAKFDPATILPDGLNWTATTHMPKYTNQDCG